MTKTLESVDQRIQESQKLLHSLAVKVHQQSAPSIELDDLIGYGQVGLAQAARDFDPARGAEFSTYAYYRVRGAIYDGLSKMSWTSRSRYNRIRYEQMAGIALQEQGTRSPDSGQDAAADDLQWLSKTTQQLAMVYLISTSGGDDEASEIPDSEATGPSAQAADRELHEKVRTVIESLPATLAVLIRTVYFEGFTLREAADSLGMSKSWASRLHAKALRQLALALKSSVAEE
jgi:RNA polymerase sigma factor for flagellar operon FliA